mgnify:FL=1
MEPVEIKPPKAMSTTGAPVSATGAPISATGAVAGPGARPSSVPPPVTNVSAAPAGMRSLQADDLPPELEAGETFGEPSSGEITLRGKLGLADKAHGFENDPANQFFPDELEEAEFFIQNELLDEAKEILAQILDDGPESARAQ